MNQIMCPSCGTLQQIKAQWCDGVITPYSLLILDCAHAFQLAPGNVRVSRETGR